MSAFEIITEEEYKDSTASAHPLPSGRRSPEGNEDAVELTWCEFCKDYYDFRYHFGEEEECA